MNLSKLGFLGFVIIVSNVLLGSCAKVYDCKNTFSDFGILKDSNKGHPVSGIVNCYFSNGVISSSSSYIKGYKRGEWEVYGYNGEIIQHGNYISSLSFEKKLRKVFENFNVVYINLWNEGKIEFLDVYVYFRKFEYESENLEIRLRTPIKMLLTELGCKLKRVDVTLIGKEENYTIKVVVE